MVVTGQTQEAGKTTTLEALISRRAPRVAFVTKRGEGAFEGARSHPAVLPRAGRLEVRRVDPRGEPRREAEVRAVVDHQGVEGRSHARRRPRERAKALRPRKASMPACTS
jgi:hypothetical protein